MMECTLLRTSTYIKTPQNSDRSLYDEYIPNFHLLARHDAPTSKANYNDNYRLYDLSTCKTLPSTDLHECIVGKYAHKMHLDIDIAHDGNISDDDAYKYVEDIIAACMRVWNVYISSFACYDASRSDFIVYSSNGPNKFSFHIICFPIYAFANNVECAIFTEHVIQLLPMHIQRYIDPIHKSSHNLRMLGVSKTSKNVCRIKILDQRANSTTIINEHYWIDSLITDTRKCIKLEPLFVTKDIDEVMAAADDDEEDNLMATSKMSTIITPELQAILDIAKAKKLTDGFIHVSTNTTNDVTYVSFKRISPSFCQICDRVHDTDNSLYIIIMPPSDYNPESFSVAKCRRDGKKSIPLSTIRAPTEHISIENVRPHSTQFDTHSLTNVYTAPLLEPYVKHRTICVDAPMKLGKTKALLDFIKRDFTADNKIRILTFRQTFAFAMYTNCRELDFILYSDHKGPLYQNRIIVQLESMHRLTIEPADLLVLDECEAIIEQLDSGLFKDFSKSFAVFQYLLRYSKCVICMDAYMSDRTFNVLKRLRGHDDMIYNRNLYSRDTDVSMIFSNNKGELIFNLIYAIKIGKKVAIMTNSKNDANAIEYLLKNLDSIDINSICKLLNKPDINITVETELRIGKYTAEEPDIDVKASHFQDINKYWCEYDVLITTPTVSAGVSFEAAHYNIVFGFFTDKSCGAEMSMQMLGRIRNVLDKQYFICINEQNYRHYTTDRSMIRNAVINRYNTIIADINIESLSYSYNQNGSLEILNSDYFAIWVENQRLKHINQNGYMLNFIKLAKKSGFITSYSEAMLDDTKNLYVNLEFDLKQIKKILKELFDLAVANATDISSEQYIDILKKIDDERNYSITNKIAQKVTKDEHFMVNKYVFSTYYKVPELLRTNITNIDVEIYYGGITRRAFKLINQLAPVYDKSVTMEQWVATNKDTQHLDLSIDLMYNKMTTTDSTSLDDKKIICMSTEVDLHFNIYCLLVKSGWVNVFDTVTIVSISDICTAVNENLQYYNIVISQINLLLDKQYSIKFNTDNVKLMRGGKIYDKSIMRFIRILRSVLKDTYMIDLKAYGRTTHENKCYILAMGGLFKFKDNAFITNMN